MLPTETYSGDALPQTPWQPPCWSKSSQQLIADAQRDLWANNGDLTDQTLNGPGDAFSGAQSAGENESEMGIDPSAPPDGGGRAKTWKANIKELYASSPLAGTPTTANPNV